MTEKEIQFKAFLNSLSEEKRMQLFEYLKKLSPEERTKAIDKILLKLQQVKQGSSAPANNSNKNTVNASASDLQKKTQPAKQQSVQIQKPVQKQKTIPTPNKQVTGTQQVTSRNVSKHSADKVEKKQPSIVNATNSSNSLTDEHSERTPRKGNGKIDFLIVTVVLVVFIALCFGLKIVLDKYVNDDSSTVETIATIVTAQNAVTNETAVGKDAITTESAEPSPTPTPAPTLVPLKADAPDLAGMTIVIDPGHQATMWAEEESVAPGYSSTKKKATPGTTGVVTGVKEYELTLDISLMLKEYLEQCGATVVLTRTTNDVQLSNQERAQVAVDNNADLFIRIHADKANDSYTSGVKVFVTNKGDYSSSLVGWGNTLGQGVADSIGLGFIGTTSSDLYTGLNYASSIPSFQLSVGLLSNSDDEAVITNPDNQVEICDSIARFAVEFK